MNPMTTPKREEPPFVSDEQIMELAAVFVDETNEEGMEMTPKLRIAGALLMMRDHFYEPRLSLLRTEQEGKWISLQEQFPPEVQHSASARVLVANKYAAHSVFYSYMYREWRCSSTGATLNEEFTHWMPLPDPPAL